MASLMLDYKYATYKDKYVGFSNQIRLPQNLIYELLSPLGLVILMFKCLLGAGRHFKKA